MDLTKQEALDFFTDFYCGEHHIPNELRACGGSGWSVVDTNYMSTTDNDRLTKLVVMAHDRCLRVSIAPFGANRYKITLHKRSRTGNISESHSTIEDAVTRIREYKTYTKN